MEKCGRNTAKHLMKQFLIIFSFLLLVWCLLCVPGICAHTGAVSQAVYLKLEQAVMAGSIQNSFFHNL